MADRTIIAAMRAGDHPVETGFAAALRRWWAQLDEKRRMRVTVQALSELDDRALDDIGVVHGDIEGAVRRRARRK